MKKKPLFSVIIPVKHLTYYLLHENLPSFEKQTFNDFEVIVLPNEHTQYDLVLLKQYKWLRIVPTGKITRPAQKRDIGAGESKGQILAFLDDDAYAHPDWLLNASKQFAKKSRQVLCGPGVLPEHTNTWEKAFDEVLVSRLGSGSYRYRFAPGEEQFVTDFPSMNFLIQKKLFQKLGGFNSNYWPGEDSKLCNDIIVKEKGKILYDPHVLVYHHRRNSLGGYLKQHGQYGFHRGAFAAHGDRNSRDLTYLIPTVFLVYLISLFLMLFISAANPTVYRLAIYYLIPLFLYCILVSLMMIGALLRSRNVLVALGSGLALTATHLVYGWQFIRGYNKGRTSRNIYE
jgi:cellulose synthase/poly-beta-1,6-N-acetylglucosamine synthase-like glycosyltransferase